MCGHTKTGVEVMLARTAGGSILRFSGGLCSAVACGGGWPYLRGRIDARKYIQTIRCSRESRSSVWRRSAACLRGCGALRRVSVDQAAAIGDQSGFGLDADSVDAIFQKTSQPMRFP